MYLGGTINGLRDGLVTTYTYSVHRIDFVVLFLPASSPDLSSFCSNYGQLLLLPHSSSER